MSPMNYDAYTNANMRRASRRRFFLRITIGMLVIIVAGFLYFVWHVGSQNSIVRFQKDLAWKEASSTSGSVNTNTQASWHTYTDTKYSFSMSYPPDWVVVSNADTDTPKITFYKTPAPVGLKPPFDHFTEATNISVFPHGIPTEGVSGDTKPTSVETQESVARGNDFVLKDGIPWATLLTFNRPPSTWGEAGFVWAKVVVNNLDTTCARGAQFIPLEQCDVLTGDRYVRSGTIDPELRATELVMLKTFAFTDHTATTTGNGNTDVSTMIHVTAPANSATISSPLHIAGEARGTWYFEASFPAHLQDANGTILWQGPIHAQGDWMTENFVPFSADIVFTKPTTQTGTLVLEKDNPSGLQKNARELRIPVRFSGN